VTIGCLPDLPNNIDNPSPKRTLSYEAGGAKFSYDEGVEDAVWIDIPNQDDSHFVGGYLSLDNSDSKDIVILLKGASTYEVQSSNNTLGFHEQHGAIYRQAGYRTLALDFQECGTAYGQGDTADVVQAIDWLNGPGQSVIGTQNIYLVGYSVGATAAIITNRQRHVTAVAAISGITEPQQLQQNWLLYNLPVSWYPNNLGMCQLGTTLATYGPPWSPGWDVLNTVAHIDELISPMIVIQGTKDNIFTIDNARHLDAAYQRALSAGRSLPLLEFFYLQGADHFIMFDPSIHPTILAFFQQVREREQ